MGETTKGDLISKADDYKAWTLSNYRLVYAYGVGSYTLSLMGISSLWYLGIGALISFYSLNAGLLNGYIDAQFEAEADKLSTKPNSHKVSVEREFRYSSREGGHWIPTNNFRMKCQ